MKELFERHRAKLTREEDRRVWTALEREWKPRRRRAWLGVPAGLLATGAALALVVVVANRDGGPGEALVAFEDERVAAAPAAGEDADREIGTPAEAGEARARRAPDGARNERDALASEGKKESEPETYQLSQVDVVGRHEQLHDAGARSPGEEGSPAPARDDAPAAVGTRGAEALKKSAPSRGGQIHLRAAGAGEERAENQGVARVSPESGPVPVGGTHPVNDRKIDAMFFRHSGVNPFVETSRDALATFAMDVDDASYAIARAYLRRGVVPPAEAVRVEAFINAFDHGYPPPGGALASFTPGLVREETFAIHLDAAPSPLHEDVTLMRVGIKAREIDPLSRKPVNLTFVIDVSGSMKRENRLDLVKRSLAELLYALQPSDQVAIVTYGNSAQVALPPTSIEDRATIEAAIKGLRTTGATNAEAGLRLGYETAEAVYDPSVVNRVILCTDGVANVGKTGPDAILAEIHESAGRGIFLTALGFGMGNYNDVLLERLANTGDGVYHYIDTDDEARAVLVRNLTGTLVTVAREAKIQVEMNPAVVTSYRLLGYENRDIADEDFRNDTVDAGEVGAGHEVTALFELRLADDPPREAHPATVRIRYEDPETGVVTEDFRTLRLRDVSRAFDRMPPSFRLDAAVAGFAEILRGSYWAKDDDLDDVLAIVRGVARETGDRPDVVELADLVARADALAPSGAPSTWRERAEDAPSGR